MVEIANLGIEGKQQGEVRKETKVCSAGNSIFRNVNKIIAENV